MAYSATTSDGVPITVADGDKDSSRLSLTLIGRNATDYGQSIFTNTLRQLENFASNSPPTALTLPAGQLWYNKSEDTLRVYNGAEWARTSSVPVSATAITDSLSTGTSYFNSTEDKLKIYDGAVFRDAVLPGGTVTSAYAGNAEASGSATNYGAKVETLFLTTTGSPSVVPVIALKYVSDGTSPGDLADAAHDSAGATVMAVFSDRAFTLNASDPHFATLGTTSSFGATFTSGMNLRADYTESIVAQAGTSGWADAANAIYTGQTIVAADIIHVGSTDWIPSGTVSTNYTLGSATNRFGDLHVDQIQLGNPATTKTVGIVGAVNIGNTSHRVNSLYVHDLSISGDLDFTDVNTLTGLETSTIGALTLTSGTIATLASANTDIVNKQYVTNALTIESLVAGKIQLVATNTTNATHYPLFSDASTGNENVRTDTGYTYNPNTGALTATKFSGVVLTDGTATLTGGALTGALGVTATGTVRGSTITDGTASLAGGSLTGAVGVTASGTVQFGSLSDGAITATAFQTTLTDSDTLIPTSGAVKDYVDAQVTAQDLDFRGDSGGALNIDLDTEVLDIAGGTNITTVGSANQITVNLNTTLTGLTSVTSTNFVGALTGTATDATNASLVFVEDDEATAATRYVTFVDNSTATNKRLNEDSTFTYNPSTGTVSATLFSGTATAARYADLAEIYSTDADYAPGTVVKLGGTAEITQTDSHADTDVFGVISTNPAYLMNKDAQGLPVAMTGRVPVKVVGTVKKGERLISSDMPGVAKGVANNHVSLQAIIGRALENKNDNGERVIEAVIGVK